MGAIANLIYAPRRARRTGARRARSRRRTIPTTCLGRRDVAGRDRLLTLSRGLVFPRPRREEQACFGSRGWRFARGPSESGKLAACGRCEAGLCAVKRARGDPVQARLFRAKPDFLAGKKTDEKHPPAEASAAIPPQRTKRRLGPNLFAKTRRRVDEKPTD